MVIYIREPAGERAARAKTTFNKPAANVVVTSEKATFRLETVVEGVTTPWGVDFLPDGRMLVHREGRRACASSRRGSSARAGHRRPGGPSKGQGGLLDVAVHPDYAKNGWIYLSFSDPGPRRHAR